jgi:hypothetical protein
MLCQHTGTRGGNAGKACQNKAVCQDKWCKKHDKKKCPALAQDEVFGAPQKANVEPAAEKQKYKFSVWHWTLNSQSDFSQMTTEQKHQFKNLVDFIFAEENIDKYLEDRTSPDDPRKNLAEVKSEYYHEVGDAQHRLHVHGAIKLQHTGNYRLSNEKIRGVVEKILGKKVHFNATGSADVERVWAQYMQKQQAAEKVNL